MTKHPMPPPSDSLAAVKHRTASGNLDGALWEFEIRRGIHQPIPLIIARILLGSSVHDVEIPICTSRKPRRFAWSIRHLGGDSWRVSCAQYGFDVTEMTQPTPFAKGMPIGGLDLLCAPARIAEELLGIDDVLT